VVAGGRGKCNTGGDGFGAPAELAARGREVSVLLLCGARQPAAATAAVRARGWKYPVFCCRSPHTRSASRPSDPSTPLLAPGLNRPVKATPCMTSRSTRTETPVLAVGPAEGIKRNERRRVGVEVREAETVTSPAQAGACVAGQDHCGRVTSPISASTQACVARSAAAL